MKTLTIRLTDELHKQLKIYAVENAVTIQDLIVELIQRELKEERD